MTTTPSSPVAWPDAPPIVWSATPTPFLADGALDHESLERVVAQHERLGVTGLFLGGTCGEGPFLPDHQRRELIRSMKCLAGGRLFLAVQVSDTSAARAVENTRLAAEAGADAVVLAPPFLVAGFCNRDFLRRYFLEPIAAAPVPVGVYVRAAPGPMALDWPLWEDVLAHPAVRLVKDSSGSAETMQNLARLKSRRPELRLLTGYEFDVLAAAAAGYDGCLVGTGILNAGLLRRALQAHAAGDTAAATRWQERSNQLLHDLFRPDLSSWLAGLKNSLVQAGVFRTEFSHLAFPIDDTDRRRIKAALERERAYIGLERVAA